MFKILSLTALFSNLRRTITMPFYAVGRGRQTGVFNTWAECEKQVKGFTGAKFRKFPVEQEAWAFVNDGAPQQVKRPTNEQPSQPLVVKQSSTPKKTILLDELPNHGIGGIGNPVFSIHLENKKVKRAEIEKQLDVISQEMQRLQNHALSLKQQLKELDETDSSDQPTHGNTWKRQGEEQSKKGTKKQRTVERESDLFSGSDTDLIANVAEQLIVYTDGCCHSNGQKKAAAGIGVYWGPDDPNNVAKRLAGRQTNNRAEIHAVCKALHQVRQMGQTSVIVKTDSQFLINSITKWIHKWKKNGWKLGDGTGVKNKDDFEELDEAQKGLTVKYVHVAAHTGIPGNEMADKLANEGARKPYCKSYKFSFEDSDDSDF